MRFYQNAIAALCVAAAVFTFAACKKDNKADQGGSAAVSEQAVIKEPWDKTKPNAYLEFIPGDALAVMASTRNLDAQSDNVKNLQAFMRKYMQLQFESMRAKIKEMGQTSKEGKMLEETLKLYDKSLSFAMDYSKVAPEWGMDADGHFDAVLFLIDKTAAGKLSVTDSAKFRTSFEGAFSDLWTGLIASMAGKACADVLGKPAFVETDISGKKWQVFDLSKIFSAPECLAMDEKNVASMPTSFAVYYGPDTVTMALTADTAVLPSLLEKAKTPFDVKNFGDTPADAVQVGYVDNVRIVGKFLDLESVAEALFEYGNDEAQKKACSSETLDILSNVAAGRFVSRISKSGNVSSSFVLVTADEIKKILRDLAAPHADLAKPGTLATIGLNFSVSNALATLQKLITAMGERNYQCRTYAQAASALKTIAPQLSNPLITGLTNSLTGVNIAIHDVSASPNNIELTDGVVVVSGKDIPSVLSKGQKLLVFDNPKLAMMNFEKGAVTAVDLKSLLNIPLKVNATLTDGDFIVATEGNDVKAIADLPKATDGRIVSVMVSGNIGKMLSAIGAGFIQLPEGSMTTLSFGVTATGVEMSADMKFDNK